MAGSIGNFTLALAPVLAAAAMTSAIAQTPEAKPVPGNASKQGQAVSGMKTSPIPGGSTTGRASKPGGASHSRLTHHRTHPSGATH